MPFAAMWMDLAMLMWSEGSWTEKDVRYHLHEESKMRHKWAYLWNRLTAMDNSLVVAKEGGDARKGKAERPGLAGANYYMQDG